MIDPNDLSALCKAIDEHPDVFASVIWQRADIEEAAEMHDINPDELEKAVDWKAWEEDAIVDGWECAIYPVAEALQEDE